MHYLVAHLYLTLLGALLLVAVGSAAVYERTLAPSGGTASWNAPFSLDNPLYSVDQPNDVRGSAPYTYAQPPLPVLSIMPVSKGATTPQTNVSFNTVFSNIVRPAQQTGVNTNDLYQYIPSGLISTQEARPKTATQQAFVVYGNMVGAFIGSFQSTHTDSVDILRAHADSRTDAAKAARVRALGNDFTALGNSLLSVESVPSSISEKHRALGNSYIALGKNLAAVADSSTDEQFLAAIGSYNSAVDSFTRNFVAIADYFVAAEVSFGPSDTGNVFTFTPQN